MSKPDLHPWLSTPEAVQAANRAVHIPEYKMPAAAKVVGSDELLSEAFAILAECALPPRERSYTACAQCGAGLENVRTGAKFCSVQCKHRDVMQRRRAGRQEALPASPKGHIGSMWSWPEDARVSYAIREVGLRLCHFVVTRAGRHEIPNQDVIESHSPAHSSYADRHYAPLNVQDSSEPSVRDVLEDYLVEHGIEFSDADSADDLIEAVAHLRGVYEADDGDDLVA